MASQLSRLQRARLYQPVPEMTRAQLSISRLVLPSE